MLPTATPRIQGAAIRIGRLLVVGLLLVAIAIGGGPRAAQARDLAVDLSMRYYHQYLGNASDNHDCGPASVGMILDAYKLRPAGTSDARFVASLRRVMGAPASIGTVYADLENAVAAYGLRWALVPSSLPGEPDAEMQMMRDAIDAGNLVIAEVHGAILGRGEVYGDHWVVVAGFTGNSVHLLDPDDQAPRLEVWVRGGNITMSLDLFKMAAMKAQPGPYGLIVYAPGKNALLRNGGHAKVSGTDGDGAYLRSSPSLADNKLTLLPEGTALTVNGPVPAANADGRDWISVTADGRQGFVAADYISPAD